VGGHTPTGRAYLKCLIVAADAWLVGEKSRQATPESDSVAANDRASLGGLIAALFVIGPTFALLGLALPHAPDANDAGLLAVVGAAYLGAVVTFPFRNRFPDWGLDLVAGYATALISFSIYFSGSTTATGAVYYLWVILGTAYFFGRRRVAVQLAVVAVAYAIALVAKPAAPGMVQAWILTVGSLGVAAALLVVTRERVAALVARLAEAADTDPLTELLNRRGFGAQLELELERARRSGSELSLVSGDLDHFKHVNDRFGHQVGDDVLVEVGDLLRSHARRTDAVARVGGEEFAILIPDAHAEGAYATAERLRHRVHEALADRYPGLTISFGIATYPRDGESVGRLLRSADESLYAAKALGRDRTVICSAEVVSSLVSRPEDAPAPTPTGSR
jgi:diguanylate cyclase (GGDEF)-like protein